MDSLNNDFVKQIMVLDTINKLGLEVPHPVIGNWIGVQSEIEELQAHEFLLIDSGTYKITKEGKKVVVLFQDIRNEMIAHLEPYKEVMTEGGYTDARIALEAFKNIGRMPRPDLIDRLLLVAAFINWDFLISQIKRLNEVGRNWQELLRTGTLFKYIDMQADPLAWRKLGRTSREAAIVATRLLKPKQDQEGLIQITRNV